MNELIKNELVKKVQKIFLDRFETTPILICSPGRVNLIGEHTDYNNGFVLPAAIDKAIVLAMARNETGKIRLHSIDMEPVSFEISSSSHYRKTNVGWANYIIGVVNELQKAGYPSGEPGHLIGGFDCVFGGDIPIGAGLSSSAALEVGTAFGLCKLFELDLSRTEMANISQRAENHFVGVQCGIMDQFAILHGKSDYVIKLDCRSLEFKRFPFKHKGLGILLCDTTVRRELAGSEYNIRRQQCEEGVAVLSRYDPSVHSLREVTLSLLESRQKEMNEVVYRRCRYVVEENRRVEEACEDLLRQDMNAFGEKMYLSHDGLRDEYEVSCRELDTLVEASQKLDGVLGARMMGGGFGGCTINLITWDQLEAIKKEIGAFYEAKTGSRPEFHVAKIGEGTHIFQE